MPKVNVKGQDWDIDSIDGNTVTLVGGQQIEVSGKTLKAIKDAQNPLSRISRRKKQ